MDHDRRCSVCHLGGLALDADGLCAGCVDARRSVIAHTLSGHGSAERNPHVKALLDYALPDKAALPDAPLPVLDEAVSA